MIKYKPALVLFPFRHFDPRTRKWVNARYKATIEQLCDRYDAFQITGDPERRNGGNRLTAGHLQRNAKGDD